MTVLLRLTAEQVARLEQILLGAQSHHRTAAERATRAHDNGTARWHRDRSHGAGDLLHVVKLAQLGPIKARAG